jgi:hypothetical protein
MIMKRIVLTATIIAACAGCAGLHTITTAGGTAAAGSPSAAAAPAKVGTAITLAGNSSGEQMRVTVVKVIPSGQPDSELDAAPSGDKYFAAQFELDDTGTAAYSDAPSNGAEVIDSSGQSYDASIADTVSGCMPFASSVNIASGESGLGCIVFEVPDSAKIVKVQFTLDSGMGPQTGQWTVGG